MDQLVSWILQIILVILNRIQWYKKKFIPPFQVPSAPPHFVNREDELKLLRNALKQGTIVALIGMGGVGKTAVAIQIAYALRKKFPDGILWARLDISNPMSILAGFAHAFQQEVKSLNDLETLSSFVRSLLRNKRSLVILDSAEDLAALKPLVVNGGQCAILITTRTTDVIVNTGAVPVPIGPLPKSNSLEMLGNLIGQEKIDAEKNEAEKLIEDHLGRLPLAMEIAGKYLRDAKSLSINDYNQLVVRDGFLDWAYDYNENTKSLYSSLEVSYKRLSKKHRKFFATLPIFAGANFSVEATAAALGFPVDETALAFGRLLSLSLLEKITIKNRYQLHILVKHFAEKKAAIGNNARKRLLEFYLDYVHQHQTASSFEALELERENILGICEWAYKVEMWDHSVTIAHALTRSRGEGFLSMRGYWSEEQILLHRAIDACRHLIKNAKVDQRKALLHDLADLELGLGDLFLNKNRYAEAIELLHDCLSVYGEIGNCKLEIAQTSFKLGIIHTSRREFEHALELFEKSLNLHKEIKSNPTLVYSWIGRTYHLMEDYKNAESHYEKSLACDQEKGLDIEPAFVLIRLGSLAFDTLEEEKAWDYLSKAEDLLKRAKGNPGYVAEVRRELANQYLWNWRKVNGMKMNFHFVKAEALHFQSLQDFQFLNDKVNIAWSLQNLGDTYFEKAKYRSAQMNLEKAEENYYQALQYFEELGVLDGQGYAYDHMGQIRLNQRKLSEARQYFERGLQAFQASGKKSGVGYLLFNLADLEFARGHHRKAAELYVESLKIWEELGHARRISLVRKKLKEVATAVESKLNA